MNEIQSWEQRAELVMNNKLEMVLVVNEKYPETIDREKEKKGSFDLLIKIWYYWLEGRWEKGQRERKRESS